MQRFVALDGLRGVAAIGVVLYHLGGAHADNPIFKHGYLAVPFFFVLSGFVIAHAYQKRLVQGLSFLSFARARLIRLYPLYLLGTLIGAIGVAAALAIGMLDTTLPELAILLGMNILLIPTPGENFADAALFPFNVPAWSLWWEIVINLFYAAIATRLSTRWLAIILVGGLVLLLATPLIEAEFGLVGGAFRHLALGPSAVVFPFFAGVALNRLYRSRAVRIQSWTPVWVPAAILVGLFSIPSTRYEFALYAAATIILMPLVVWVGAAYCDPKGATARACALLGDASFALYALHIPLSKPINFLALKAFGAPIHELGWIAALPTCAGLVVAAIVVDRILDRPFRRWLNQRLTQTSTPAGAPSEAPGKARS